MDKMKNNGIFVSFEGGEGSGKSTQVHLLAEKLRRVLPDREIIETRSPGGTPAAERIRDVLKRRDPAETLAPESELLLFGACHRQMMSHLIRPALTRGAVILSDRFFDSTTVYQGFGRGLNMDMVRSINRFACGDFRPDLTILLDLDVETSLQRTLRRAGDAGADRFDSEQSSFHERIRRGFLELAGAAPDRFIVIDAAASASEVQLKIWEAVREKLVLL